MNPFPCVLLPDHDLDFQLSPFGTQTPATLRLLKDYLPAYIPLLHLHSLHSRFSGFTFAKMLPLLKAFVLTLSSAWSSSPTNTHMATSLTYHKWWPPARSPLTKSYLKLQSSLHHLLTSHPLFPLLSNYIQNLVLFPFFNHLLHSLFLLPSSHDIFYLLTYVTHSFLHLLFIALSLLLKYMHY